MTTNVIWITVYIISLKSESSSISVVYIAEKTPRTLRFASRYLDADSNFKVEALNQSINQFNNFAIWSYWGYFEAPWYILRCPVEISGLSILGQNHTHYFEW